MSKRPLALLSSSLPLLRSSSRPLSLASLASLASLLLAGAACAESDDALEPTDPAPASLDAAADAAAACAIAPVTIKHTAGAVREARIHKLSPAEHPQALCNDGTPAYYIFRPGFGAGAKRWHVFLEGGGSCNDGEACAQRYRTSRGLMSSSQATDGALYTQTLHGAKSPSPMENPDFYDANLVQIHYCSSDHWTGDQAAVAGAPIDEMTRWHFRGRAIVSAVFEELTELGLGSAEELLLNGGSAGGMGVSNTADDVRARLPASTRMLAMHDAGFGLIYPPYDTATRRETTESPTDNELAYLAATLSWGGRGDATCEARAADELARAACRVPSATFPTSQVTTHMFIRQSQLDAVQTGKLIDAADKSPSATAYRERFGAQMRATLAGLPAHFSVFSTHDAEHGMMSEWTTTSIGGVTLRDAVGAWYRNPCRGGGKRIEP